MWDTQPSMRKGVNRGLVVCYRTGKAWCQSGNLLCSRAEGSCGERGRVWLRKTSPGDRGFFISLLRVNLIFTVFRQTQILRDFGELNAKDVCNQPISRMIFVKTQLCGMWPNGHPVLREYWRVISKYLSPEPFHRLIFFARPGCVRGLREKHGSCRR